MVIKMQDLAVPRGLTAGLAVCASPFGARARKAPAWAAPNRSLRREMKWSGELQKCRGMVLVVEQEIEFVEEGPLDIGQPLIASPGAGLLENRQFVRGGIAAERGEIEVVDGVAIVHGLAEDPGDARRAVGEVAKVDGVIVHHEERLHDGAGGIARVVPPVAAAEGGEEIEDGAIVAGLRGVGEPRNDGSIFNFLAT